VSATNPTRPPLGQMLVQKGLVAEQDLLRALRVHEETRRPLGEVLVELGAISVTSLADALLLQHAWRPLGRMLVDKGLLTEDDLSDALAEQERTGRPLGEIVRIRYRLSASEIGDVLAEQRERELEMDRGFGSGLRRGIDQRHRRAHGLAEHAEEDEMEGPLGPRLDSGRENDRLSVLEAALEDREETISAPGVANRERRDEVAALRERVADQARVIEELRARVAELEHAAPANGADSPS
jgi:hypothetical protein